MVHQSGGGEGRGMYSREHMSWGVEEEGAERRYSRMHWSALMSEKVTDI